MKDYICGVRQRRREMFVPLTHPPGHAQVDFGEALAVIGGVERKIHFLAMSGYPTRTPALPKAYPGETTEAFCDGHSLGGSRLLRRKCRARSFMTEHQELQKARILGDGKRQRTRAVQRVTIPLPVRGPELLAAPARGTTNGQGRGDRRLYAGRNRAGADAKVPELR